ncbi:hypothetical protein [Reichenbachiella sp. 5M10]|uniref:hypothetical protein n=1 Tax=Reichenbachiella sp. 5M10 TaxID=1889772 RepID=UPI00117BC86A|nr:hypothetical protein [Reichenbachiella sp. 5M10]
MPPIVLVCDEDALVSIHGRATTVTLAASEHYGTQPSPCLLLASTMIRNTEGRPSVAPIQ